MYWDALLAVGQVATLQQALTEAAEKGDRALAAVAQVKRGDLDLKEGRPKDALVDGYLRTVVLFADVKDVQPEALYKAAGVFEDLGEHGHAEKMRKKLLSEFPESEYSTRLKSGA